MLDKRQLILNELYNTGFIQNFTKSFAKQNDIDFLEDEIQDIFLIACEIPEHRLIAMYEDGGINAVRRFLSGVIHRQMNSTTSAIHNRYRKRQGNTYSTEGMETEEIEKCYKIIENEYKTK
jgi:TRAP-type mannitol/chloroaromatic compound transport system substrate-binding protein